MHLKSLKIKGFKSLAEIELIEPGPLTVFVGANSVGRSNIFEALEFFNFCTFTHPDAAIKDFGGLSHIYPATPTSSDSINLISLWRQVLIEKFEN